MKAKRIKGKKMKATNVFVTILSIGVVLSLLVGGSGATWCNNDYAKRINISVDNTGGTALTDYQVYVNLSANPINETSLRVYNSSDCTLRSHWTENETGGNSYGVWINYSSIATSAWTNNTAIYYNNTPANSISNITTTFLFGDDFQGIETDYVNFSRDPYGAVLERGGSGEWDDYAIREKLALLLEDDIIHIWYCGQGTSGSDYDIGYANSTDGKNFTKYDGNPVINTTDQEQDPCVVKNNSMYYMYIEHGDFRIDRYNSSNKITWTFEQTVTGLNGKFTSPVVWIEGSVWHILYEDYNPTPAVIRYANSSDGLSWTNDVLVLTESFDTVPDSIIKVGSLYHLYYHGATNDQGEWHATSTNLTTWNNRTEVIDSYNGYAIGSFTVFLNNNELWAYGWWSHNNLYYLLHGFELNSSKWIRHTKGYKCFVGVGTDELTLGGSPNHISSANIYSIQTFNNDIIMELRRKQQDDTNHQYMDVSLGAGDIVDDGGGTNNWWHTTLQSGYFWKIQSNTNARIYEVPSSGAATALGIEFYPGSFSIYRKEKYVYNNSGWLGWYINNNLEDSATDTTFLSDNKHILLSQGEYTTGAGGFQFIDWIFVRKYALPEPASELGSEEDAPTPPVISNVINGSISTTSQYIDWDVNQVVHNRVLYSNESDLTPAYYSSWENTTNAPNITLSGLEASTQYWYQAWSYNTTNTSLCDNSSTLSFTTTSAEDAVWCNNDYAKRINISVNNTGGGALTDYQVFINSSTNPINETSLRIYNSSDCTLRSHWCENITNGNCTKLWIKYSAIAASAWTNNTAIYYNNAAVSSASNGTNTFEFFDDFDVFTDLQGNFTSLANIPVNKDQCGFEECGGLLYAVGGYNGTASTNAVYSYNITTDTWVQKANAPISVQSPVLRAVNGKLYLIGGLDNSDGYVKNGTYEYDPATNVWTQKADMPTAREDMASAVVNNKIYVIGGLYQGGGSSYRVGDVEVYDPSTDTWDDTIADMPNLRCLGDFGAAYGDLIFLVSACDSYYGAYPLITSSVRVDQYNTTTDTWTQKANMTRPRSYKEVEEVDGKLWIIGGSNTSASVSVDYVEIYDIANNTWIAGTSYPAARSGVGLTKVGSTIYCVGGRVTTSSTAVNTLYALDTTVYTSSDLNLDKWTKTHTEGGFTQTDSIISLYANAGNHKYSLTSKTGYSPNTILRMKCKFEMTTALYQVTRGGWCSNTGFDLAKDSNQILASTATAYVQCGNGTDYDSQSISSTNFGDWYTYEIARLGTNTKVYNEGVLIRDCPYDLNGDRYISLYVRDSERRVHSDWVLVRKYASSEPTSTLGSEEQQGANPTLHIDNAINIKEDWGRDFNSNLSANVTTANASDVWMNFSNAEFTNASLGNLNLTLNEWVNESHNVNAPVTNVSVSVTLNSTTSGCTNDTDSFWYEVTKRTNTATMDSAATQNVDTAEPFYVNATCNEEYGDTFLGAANLLEDGAIIDTNSSVTNYVNFSHSESGAGQYNYTIRFYNLTHYVNATTPMYSNVTVFAVMYEPPDPTTLANTTGNFWINHTWSAGSGGNVTDSFNVSVFPGWYNATVNTYYNDSGLTPHDWSNITVWAYNNSGNGSLSKYNVSDDVQIPNNIPVLSGLPDNTTDEDVNQTDIFDLDDYFTDADSDTPTYQVENNNQSAYVDVTINASNNVSYTLASGWNGTASVVINVTDGWEGEDSDTFLIIVNAAPLPGDYTPGDPTNLQNTTGNFWVNYTWNVGGGNTTDSYNVSWNLTWFNNTLTTYMQKDVGASGWANITVYAYNSSGNGSLSTGYISDEAQAPSAPIGDYVPQNPTNLVNSSGNGWVNYTWNSGAGNITDSYNVSWNLTWYNNTLVPYMNDSVGEFGWANISVWAYNSSGNGSLSAGSISDETQAEGGTYTTSMGTTVYNLITYYGSSTSTAEQFGLDIGSVDYIAMYNGSFYTHTMGFSANNFTTYHGIGYYVYLNASGSSTYQRNNIPEVPYNTQLYNRWNTIGWTNATNTNAEGVAASIGSACKYTSMLNADGWSYTTHTVGFTSNNHAVNKGKGYWVWTNTGVSWSRNS